MNRSPLAKTPLQRRPLAAYRLRRTIALLRRKRDAANRKAAACLTAGRGFTAEIHEFDAYIAECRAADAYLELVPLMDPSVARVWKALI